MLPIEQWRQEFAPNFIGRDAAIMGIFEKIQRVADTACSILITGPSGTGKELVARSIHRSSGRTGHSFVAINCAAIPRELMESEMFGHAKGAFTGATAKREGKFQIADQGTLFLDELGEMDLDLQAKLLRVVQENEFTPVGETRPVRTNVRLISATNQNLEEHCRDGKFRQDLFYRLNVINLEIPPLRDRPGDIWPLTEHFIRQANSQYGREIQGTDAAVRHILETYPWLGNIRELENTLQAAVLLKRAGDLLTVEDLPARMRAEPASGGRSHLAETDLPEGGLDLKETLAQIETRLIVAALQRCDGNKAQAAKLLRLKRTTLIERLRKQNIIV